MENLYKVTYETFNNSVETSYYTSTSIPVLLYWLGYDGAAVGNIVEIKRVMRSPRYAKVVRAI